MVGGVYLGVVAKERKRKEAVGKKIDSEGTENLTASGVGGGTHGACAAVVTVVDAITATCPIKHHHSNELV